MIKLKDLLREFKELGDCYQANGRLVMSNWEYTLVHGVVSGQGPLQGKRYGHCWAEYAGRVFDHSNGRKIDLPDDVYYAAGKIRKEDNMYYTSSEAAEVMLKDGTWGPWHEDAIDVVDENIPGKTSEIGKEDIPISREYLLKAKRNIQND